MRPYNFFYSSSGSRRALSLVNYYFTSIRYISGFLTTQSGAKKFVPPTSFALSLIYYV